MYWVIQYNINRSSFIPLTTSERGEVRLVEYLRERNIPWSAHTVVPFSGELIPDVRPAGKVICWGALSMRNVARERGWAPGIYDIEPVHFGIQRDHWGSLMLNADAELAAFKDIDPREGEHFFLRPAHDTKSFSGQVFGAAEFRDWKKRVIDTDSSEALGVNGNTLVVKAPLKDIDEETRCWIVDGRCVTASTYKTDGRLKVQPLQDLAAAAFAVAAARLWSPHVAFCLDVARVDGEYRIIETNSINSSGFYAAEVDRIVDSLEQLESSPPAGSGLGAA